MTNRVVIILVTTFLAVVSAIAFKYVPTIFGERPVYDDYSEEAYSAFDTAYIQSKIHLKHNPTESPGDFARTVCTYLDQPGGGQSALIWVRSQASAQSPGNDDYTADSVATATLAVQHLCPSNQGEWAEALSGEGS